MTDDSQYPKDMTDDSQFPKAELARLADGSLPASREAELREELARRPQLASALAEQERAITLVRSNDTPAPASLHRWVQEQTAAAKPPPSRLRLPQIRLGVLVPVTAALAAAVIALVVVIGNNGAGTPTLSQATRLALSSPTGPAPAETTPGARTLDVSAGGLPFPYWGQKVGWHATGVRTGRISGRPTVTVFYRRLGHTVGYTIVTGAPLAVKGGRTLTHDGVQYTFIRQGPVRLVTWVRGYHTCVIAGRSVTDGTLLKLADIPA
jgi:hypothetical protein